MRTRRLGNGYRLYLSEHDYQTLLNLCEDRITELAVRFGGECGCRVSETVELQPRDIKQSTNPEIDARFLAIRNAKDTTGETDGKYREAFIPQRVETVAHEHVLAEDLDETEEFIPYCKRTVQGYLKDLGERAANVTGEEMWNAFSSHDLRAFFASNLMVRYDVNIEVVMEIGGWEDYDSLKPYLDKPGDDVIVEALEDVEPVTRGYKA